MYDIKILGNAPSRARLPVVAESTQAEQTVTVDDRILFKSAECSSLLARLCVDISRRLGD